MRFTPIAATLLAATTLASTAIAGNCPEGSPEGYEWLAGYVDEYRAEGTVSEWFVGSFAENPDDYALRALNTFFESDGDLVAARQSYIDNGGLATEFDAAMACANANA